MASDNRGTPPPAGFSASDIRRRMAQREAEKAAAEIARMRAEEDKKKALLEEFHKPPARTPEQLHALVMQLVSQAAERGEHEVQVYRFPSTLCADSGRAINNFEANWEATLDGRPKLAFDAWRDHLQPLGFGLQARVLDYPGGMPGDIGLFLTW
jgi:hypothetical protein